MYSVDETLAEARELFGDDAAIVILRKIGGFGMGEIYAAVYSVYSKALEGKQFFSAYDLASRRIVNLNSQLVETI